jgi:carbamoyltransferase
VFVQPASHDAGGALGAALAIQLKQSAAVEPAPLRHLYWGTPTPRDDDITAELRRWARFVTFERLADPVQRTAELLANGSVIGWVQGASEFGPRALGNRSILADPRPAENKGRINDMVKKREGYRPFAPAVPEEAATEYFDIQAGRAYPYMIFVVPVREDKRALLGAVTHVDGSARLQTVSRESNSRFYDLLRAFEARTGCPVLLNTSFNNNAEPIVDSVRDAVECFLTTAIDALVVGDYIVERRDAKTADYLELYPSSPPFLRFVAAKVTFDFGGGRATRHTVVNTAFPEHRGKEISAEAFELLGWCDGTRPLKAFVTEPRSEEAVATMARDLWSSRMLWLYPEPGTRK